MIFHPLRMSTSSRMNLTHYSCVREREQKEKKERSDWPVAVPSGSNYHYLCRWSVYVSRHFAHTDIQTDINLSCGHRLWPSDHLKRYGHPVIKYIKTRCVLCNRITAIMACRSNIKNIERQIKNHI